MPKKKKPKSDLSIAEITNRLRGFLLDSQIQNGHELALLVGCSPISDDVADREDEESDKRIEEVAHLIPILYAYSHTMAEAATEYQRANMDENLKIPEEIWRFSRKMTEQISMSALLGAVSQLVDMGILQHTKSARKGWFR
jgi:hypothetical protein